MGWFRTGLAPRRVCGWDGGGLGRLGRNKTDDGDSELLFAIVRKLTLLTIGFAAALAFAGAANAAPIPQEQGSNCDSNYSGACVPIASVACR